MQGRLTNKSTSISYVSLTLDNYTFTLAGDREAGSDDAGAGEGYKPSKRTAHQPIQP